MQRGRTKGSTHCACPVREGRPLAPARGGSGQVPPAHMRRMHQWNVAWGQYHVLANHVAGKGELESGPSLKAGISIIRVGRWRPVRTRAGVRSLELGVSGMGRGCVWIPFFPGAQ